MNQKLMYHQTWELAIVYFLKIEMAEPDYNYLEWPWLVYIRSNGSKHKLWAEIVIVETSEKNSKVEN